MVLDNNCTLKISDRYGSVVWNSDKDIGYVGGGQNNTNRTADGAAHRSNELEEYDYDETTLPSADVQDRANYEIDYLDQLVTRRSATTSAPPIIID